MTNKKKIKFKEKYKMRNYYLPIFESLILYKTFFLAKKKTIF